ncbi:MAG: hypothetical protein ACTSRU_12980 [Candidatus Hodarchaeales archaeon]
MPTLKKQEEEEDDSKYFHIREFRISCKQHGESVLTYGTSTLPEKIRCPTKMTHRCSGSKNLNSKMGRRL